MNIEFFNFSKKLLKVNFKKLNNNELAKLYDKLANLEIKSHGYALPTTWFVDCDGEDFSKLLLAMTKEIISKSSLKLNVAETFSKLTTPAKLSLTAQEELASLKVVKSIKEDPKARKIFLQKNISKIGKDLTKLNKPLYRKVSNHYRKWQWTPYTYIGPSYDLE